MRPKKKILIVDANEQSLSIRSFLLTTRGYDVIAVPSASHALQKLAKSLPNTIDLLLIEQSTVALDNRLIKKARKLHQYLPTMVTVTKDPETDSRADVYMVCSVKTTAELMERIRVLVARKRGPKPSKPDEQPCKQAAGFEKRERQAA